VIAGFSRDIREQSDQYIWIQRGPTERRFLLLSYKYIVLDVFVFIDVVAVDNGGN